jgi:hypothetical protein
MAGIIKSALPTHLKPNTGDEQGNERRHGKTRSHMVSLAQSFTLFWWCCGTMHSLGTHEDVNMHHAMVLVPPTYQR